MKILLLTHKFFPDVGGTEANAEFLANSFVRFGAEVRVITWTKSTGSKEFPYLIIRSPKWIRLIEEHKWADVVFENSPVLRLSWPNLLIRKPLLVSLNTWIDDDGKVTIITRLKYEWLKRASIVIAVSNAVKKRCWPPAVVIENAYNEDLFVNIKPISQRTKHFVFLGRLVSDKGADLAIKAVARLKQLGYTKELYNLTIIGGGIDLEYLRQLTVELKLEADVSFTGPMSGVKLVSCLNEHKYLLVPSVWQEPFGIVALEGMACGCIPIVSNGGGLPDAVGQAGVIFERNELDDFVEKILSLMEDKQLRERLSSAAKYHLEEHSPGSIARKYYTLIESLVKSNFNQ